MNPKNILLGAAIITALTIGTTGCTKYESRMPRDVSMTNKTITELSSSTNQTPPALEENPEYQARYEKAKLLADEGKYREAVKLIETIPLTKKGYYNQFMGGGDYTKTAPTIFDLEAKGYYEAIITQLLNKYPKGARELESLID